MNSILVRSKEITVADFKSYLKLQKSEVRWFIWHIISDLSEYRCWELTHEQKRIGVLCSERNESPCIDIYIGDEYRQLGFGKQVLIQLRHDIPQGWFKVNKRNTKSLMFFDALTQSQILSVARISSDFKVYQYNNGY